MKNFLRLSAAASIAFVALASSGLSLSSSSQAGAAVGEPVECGIGPWVLQRTVTDDTGVLQSAVEDAVKASYTASGRRIDWQLSIVHGQAGGFLYHDEITVVVHSRPSLDVGGAAPLDDDGPVEALAPDVTVQGYDPNGNFQVALDDAVAKALESFPGADIVVRWGPGPVSGESSTSDGINDIYVNIVASLQGSSGRSGFSSDGSSSKFADPVLVVGTDESGVFQDALENAIANAKVVLETDHITFDLACITGEYGPDGKHFVNNIYAYIRAAPK